MSWDSEIEARYMNDVEKEKKVINDNLPIIMDRTPAAVLNLPGAAQQITTSKNATQASIDAIRRRTTEIAKIVDDITNNTSATRNAIETKRQEVDVLKKTVTQGEVLDGIRKEQVAALHGKTDGSRHSSWMGLWRPLAQESRTGLFVASIAFALIALISLIYMFWDQIIQLFPASSSGPKPNEARNASAYFGGFAKRFPIKVSKL
jgi:hypothetical protein